MDPSERMLLNNCLGILNDFKKDTEKLQEIIYLGQPSTIRKVQGLIGDLMHHKSAIQRGLNLFTQNDQERFETTKNQANLYINQALGISRALVLRGCSLNSRATFSTPKPNPGLITRLFRHIIG